MHLYSWNSMTLGNLFKHCGYEVKSIDRLRYMWPNNYMKVREKYGQKLFNSICYINALINKNYQIRIVASK